jgi:hypothetical protein
MSKRYQNEGMMGQWPLIEFFKVCRTEYRDMFDLLYLIYIRGI